MMIYATAVLGILFLCGFNTGKAIAICAIIVAGLKIITTVSAIISKIISDRM